MTPEYQLVPSQYLFPTPGGAYYASTAPDSDPARALLLKLMTLDATPLLEMDLLRGWSGSEDAQQTLELLFHMQSVGWIQGLPESLSAPQGTLEEVLPELLSRLSSVNRALLADNEGFYVASHGYPYETAVELSALSGDLSSLYERHHRLLHNNMGIRSGAWALVSAAGDSEIGFWPLHIGAERFVLVISGLPRLNQPAFTHLIWALAKRYAHMLDSIPDNIRAQETERGAPANAIR